jgi:hypothetical protein
VGENEIINPDNQQQPHEVVNSDNQQTQQTVTTESQNIHEPVSNETTQSTQEPVTSDNQQQPQENINPDNGKVHEPVIISEPAANTKSLKNWGVQKGAKRGGYKKFKEHKHIEEATIVQDESTQKLDEFNNENIQYEEVKAEQPKAAAQNTPPVEPVIEVKQPEEVKVFVPKYNTDLFNGLFLIKIFDFVFPHVLKKILVLFGVKKAKRLKPAELKLDNDERGDFSDLADEVAPYIFGKIPPAILLTIFFGYTYSRKTMAALEKLPDE